MEETLLDRIRKKFEQKTESVTITLNKEVVNRFREFKKKYDIPDSSILVEELLKEFMDETEFEEKKKKWND